MKKKRLISLIAAFSLVFTGVTAYVPSGVYAEENVQMENLVQGKAAICLHHSERLWTGICCGWELPQKQFSGILQI